MSEYEHSKYLNILLVLKQNITHTFIHINKNIKYFSRKCKYFQTNIQDLSNINLKCFHVLPFLRINLESQNLKITSTLMI